MNSIIARSVLLASTATMFLSGGALSAQPRTLTLEEALATAFDNHPTARASEYASQAAKANVNVARGAFLPTLDFVAGYTRGTGNLVPTPGPQGFGTATTAAVASTNQSYNFFDFGLVLEQPIWDFGRTLGAYDASKAAARAAEADLRTVRLDIWFGVVTAYYGVLAAQEMKGVALRTRDQTRVFADRAQEMYEVGARPRIDVVRTETDAQAAEAAYVGAEETLKLAASALLAAMGTTERFEFDVARPVGPKTSVQPPELDGAVVEALGNRPERAAMKARIKEQENTLTSIEGEYYPTLAATGEFTDAGIEADQMVWNWQVGVGLTFPILSFATTMYSVEAQKAAIRAVEEELRGLDLVIRSQVEQARSRVVQTAARMQPVKAALEASKEAMTFALERYKVGEGNQVELLQAQRALADSEAARVRAEYDLALAWMELWRAMGRIPTPPDPS